MPPASSVARQKKSDPFLDALNEDAAGDSSARSRPRTRARPPANDTTIGADTRPRRGAPKAARASISLAPHDWPVPLRAAGAFALAIGLATLLTPLIGRVVFGPGGLDNVALTFAAESGVSATAMVSTAPMLAAAFAFVVYFNARTAVTRIAQSVSRGLLVVLLTWMSFGAWATKLWCLPQDYSSCYSTVLIVSGLLGGGPVLLAGLLAGYLLGRQLLGQRRPVSA